jgi:hypothetical protein
MIGFDENIGLGFPKIIAAWKEAGWKEALLKIRLEVEEVRLTLYLPTAERLIENDPKNELHRNDVLKNVLKKLNERQRLMSHPILCKAFITTSTLVPATMATRL